ncbi:MAG: hypothetical protein MUO40_12885 [Anaerolineaceae bacterium]|nr:hypothetical protein [Anaerolineaceae bacterium]
MSKKTIGLILLVAGHLLAIVSLIADYIGLGTSYGINWAQIVGVTVGAVVAVVGLWLMLKNSKTEE